MSTANNRRRIKIIDLYNGDVFIRFGRSYAHVYYKGDEEQIKNAINEFCEEGNCDGWENNEIASWKECFESDTTGKLTLRELWKELYDYNHE